MSNTQPNNPTKLKPVQDNVLIKIISPDEKKSDGGLHLLQNQREKQQMGLVIDCGPGKYGPNGVRVPLEVKPWDVIYFGVFKGVTITVDGDDYLMMREKDITAVDECLSQQS